MRYEAKIGPLSKNGWIVDFFLDGKCRGSGKFLSLEARDDAVREWEKNNV